MKNPFRNIRKKIAYLLYGEEIRQLIQNIKLNKLKYKAEHRSNTYMHSQYTIANDQYLKAKGAAIAYTEQNKCLLKSVQDDNSKYAELEDKYFKLSNEKSKEVLLFEDRLKSYNDIFLKTAPTIQRQGDSEPITTTIGKSLKEFGLYPLLNKYPLYDLVLYFEKLRMPQGDYQWSNPYKDLITLVYLFAHQAKIKEEKRWSSSQRTKNKATKILKEINENR